MKTRKLIIISTLIALFLGSCKSTSDLTEDEVYTILNEIIADDSLYIDKACWKFQSINMTTEMKNEFLPSENKFLVKKSEVKRNA